MAPSFDDGPGVDRYALDASIARRAIPIDKASVFGAPPVLGTDKSAPSPDAFVQ
jgi:hypothetical protein